MQGNIIIDSSRKNVIPRSILVGSLNLEKKN